MRTARRRVAAGLAAGVTAACCALVALPSPVVSAGERPPRPKSFGKIVFASDEGGDYELYVMRADGSHLRQVTHNRVDDYDASWSPDGHHIVFERGNYLDDLYIKDIRGGRAQPWITSKNLDEGEAEWSPDGKWIAFRGNDWGDGADVIAVSVDERRGKIVSSQDENSVNAWPSWSPDSEELALVEVTLEGGDVFIASRCCSGGFQKRRVTHDKSAEEGYLDWSPDGSCILYARPDGEVAGDELYAVSPDGGDPRRVLQLEGDQGAPAWSPDGGQIAFDSNHAGSWDVYVMNADGTGMRPLRAKPKVREIEPAWWGRADSTSSAETCPAPAPASPTPSPLLSLTPLP
jgi:TolB protein